MPQTCRFLACLRSTDKGRIHPAKERRDVCATPGETENESGRTCHTSSEVVFKAAAMAETVIAGHCILWRLGVTYRRGKILNRIVLYRRACKIPRSLVRDEIEDLG